MQPITNIVLNTGWPKGSNSYGHGVLVVAVRKDTIRVMPDEGEGGQVLN